MIDRLRSALLRALRVPPRPQPPTGDPGRLVTFRASPRYFQYRFALWCISQLTALAALIGGALFLRFAVASAGPARLLGWWGILEVLAWLVFIAQLPVSFVLLRLDFEMRWYLLTDRSLRIREGMWTVREKTLTYANIQNISIRKNPLQRLFGLATVAVQAAGGGSAATEHKGSGTGAHTHEARFEGVDNSDEIREILRKRIRQYRDSGLGDPDDVAHEHDDEAASHRMAAASTASPALLAARALLEEARALRAALAG